MLLSKTLKVATRKPKEGGFSLVELMVAVLTMGILSAVGMFVLVNASNTANIASMRDNLQKLSTEVDKSLIAQDKDKMVVENGGKFPKVELVVDKKASTGTLLVGDIKSLIELETSSSAYYDVVTDLDGYTIRGYKVDSRSNSKELVMQYDSNAKELKIEK